MKYISYMNLFQPNTADVSSNLLTLTGQDYLKTLGEKVRQMRARRGITRKQLARDSGLSERYLAQLEAGQGNISIINLRQVAKAMGLQVSDLTHEGPEPAVELRLLWEKLNRFNSRQLAAAAQIITDQFNDSHNRNHYIALIGLRGAGKTTLGRFLAEYFEIPFIELAKEIEKQAGMRVNEIFSLAGQATYRREERRALDQVLERFPQCVIATGGGLVSEPSTYERLLDSCFTIWIQAAPEEHMSRVIAQGDRRPMAGNKEAMDDLKRILNQRHDLYAKADLIFDTTGQDIAHAREALIQLVRKHGLFTAKTETMETEA